jgi:hypothetical protein
VEIVLERREVGIVVREGLVVAVGDVFLAQLRVRLGQQVGEFFTTSSRWNSSPS